MGFHFSLKSGGAIYAWPGDTSRLPAPPRTNSFRNSALATVAAQPTGFAVLIQLATGSHWDWVTELEWRSDWGWHLPTRWARVLGW